MSITERELTAEEKTEFANVAKQARQNLGLPEAAEPAAVVKAVDAFVDAWQTARKSPIKRMLRRGGPDPVDVALGLGAIWGDALVGQFGWQWVVLQENGRDWYAVVSPDRAFAIYPTYFVKACLDNPQADCTALLVYNMLAAGSISGLPASGYVNVMAGVQRVVPKR